MMESRRVPASKLGGSTVMMASAPASTSALHKEYNEALKRVQNQPNGGFVLSDLLSKMGLCDEEGAEGAWIQK